MINKIGRRLYFEVATGNILVDTGEKIGYVVQTTVEEDIASYKVLSERNRNTFDHIELPYGAYAQDFAECNGYRVNPETKQLEFSYPDPNATEPQEPVYRKPLSEELEETKQAIAELALLITQMGGM